jgi:cell fate (sporulation/competence/biofilm development) regulator YmcA (YheA/YmcA/DUF963 family)
MTLKEQQKQIGQLQRRISDLVDEMRTMQSDVKQFKRAVASDMKRLVEEKKK